MRITPFQNGAFQTNAYFVEVDNRVILIDAPAPAERIINFLKSKGLSLDLIILTHGHFDHVLALKKLKSEFSNLEIAISKRDASYLEDQSKLLKDASYFNIMLENKDYLPLPKATIMLDDNDEIGPFKVIATPGHTPGSISLLRDDILFTGDTLFYSSVGRTDLLGGDYTALVKSLERLKSLDDNITILPGHGRSSTIGFEKQNNPYM